MEPLRPSLFPNVPPFINYIPTPDGKKIFPPARLREQLWRIPQGVINVLDMQNSVQKKKQDKEEDIEEIIDMVFPDNVVTIGNFKNNHFGCPLTQFCNLPQLSRKDLLWFGHSKMLSRYGSIWGQIIPQSFVIPAQWENLKEYATEFDKKHDNYFTQRKMFSYYGVKNQEKPRLLWIVKPSNSNGGHGIEIKENIDAMNKVKDITIVQKYIDNPYLINGHKFDMRLYVLITSFDPLMIYLYGDGLVRFATQPYSNDSENVSNKFIHLTNFEINKHGDFIYNNDPSERCGHKWSLKSLWKHLKEWGLPVEEFGIIWTRIRDLVIKSVLSGLKGLREDFRKSYDSRYNCYKILGYDVMLDATFCPHLLEVNSRPSVYQELLDEAINQPMVEEIFRIVGYHLPPNIAERSEKDLKLLCSMLDIFTVERLLNITFCEGLYNKIFTKTDMEKQTTFNKIFDREDWLHSIISNLSPMDVRILIKSEEEFNACQQFDRIFPSSDSHKYFPFFDEVSYYDKLLDAVEFSSLRSGNRDEIRQEIRYKCIEHYPEGFGNLKVAAKTNLEPKKEFRKSFTNMKDLQSKLNGMGTLRKSKTIDESLTRKLNSCHISRKYQATNKISLLLQEIDKLSWPQFLSSIRASRLLIPMLNSENICVHITGDITLSSLELKYIRSGDKQGISQGVRRYHSEFDPFITSQTAACRQMLRERVLKKLEGEASFDNIVVGINLGVCQKLEKVDPVQTVENIIDVVKQFGEKGIKCFVMSVCPVLVSESRSTPFSATWSSAVNHHLHQACHQYHVPYLPLHQCFYSEVSGKIVVAPSRKLVISKGVLGIDGKLRIASEIVDFIQESQKKSKINIIHQG